MAYAENTSVPVEKSKAELERLLIRYGAEQFTSGWDQGKAFVMFKANARVIRFVLPLPSRDEKRFTHQTPRATYLEPKPRSPTAALELWEQACRQRWRALCLVVKAKLEAVDSGITSFEHEFLAHIVLPDGKTVGTYATKAIATAYETQKMPASLIGIPDLREETHGR